MKTFTFILVSSLILGACSSEPSVVHLRTEKGKKELKAPVKTNSILTMEIEGMTCEMGCGGTIRKELKATKAVGRVKFIDFTEGQEKQTARVAFDSTKISAEELIKIVSTINENQFTVVNSKVEKRERNMDAATSENSNSSEEEKVELSESTFAIPNLLDILSGFVI